MATWDTDVKQNSTIADRSGLYAIEFIANRQGAMETGYRPVEVGASYHFAARVRTSLIGANDTVEVTARWYTSAKAFVSSQNVFVSGVLPSAGIWHNLAAVFDAPATAAFATIRVEKDDTTTAYVAYCDYAAVTPKEIGFLAYRTATQSITQNSQTIIQFSSEQYDYGFVFDSVTNYRFTAPADGPYLLSASAILLSASAGVTTELALWKNGAVWVFSSNDQGGKVNLQVPAPPVFLAAGDYVDVRIWHNDVAARNLDGHATTLKCYFGGVALR